LRIKEDADDYRYFPDPDLIPLLLSAEEIDRVQSDVPELAEQRSERFQTEYGLSEYDAVQLTASPSVAKFFEAAAKQHGAAKVVANWILRDVMQALNERELAIDDSPFSPDGLARLIRMVDESKTTVKSARGLVAELVESGGDPEVLVAERGLAAVSDTGIIERAVSEVLAENPERRGEGGELPDGPGHGQDPGQGRSRRSARDPRARTPEVAGALPPPPRLSN